MTPIREIHGAQIVKALRGDLRRPKDWSRWLLPAAFILALGFFVALIERI